jgi:extensin-like protein
VEVTQAKASASSNPFAVTTIAKTNPFVVPTAVVKAPPPTPPAEAVAPPQAPSAELESRFVKAVHDDACLTFGTVLGPAANEAHKNHFHLDMKARRRNAFCE